MNPVAQKLGLTSSRFNYNKMSSEAEERLEYAKKKDNDRLTSADWYKWGYAYTDVCEKLLKECPDQIDRVTAENLSIEDFISNYEKLNKPVIIKNLTKTWNVEKYWTFEAIYQRYKDEKFKIAQDDDGYPVRVRLKSYFEYLVNQQDDSPLYLFESSLEDRKEARDMIKHYNVPIYFSDDILKIMGEKKRPPFRWFLIGPKRSGTTVHIDPLGTSAWNTSLHGHKRWVLFPNEIPKEIVKGKKYLDKGEEYEAIAYFSKILPKIKENEGKYLKIIEFIQYPGETVFVPGGWWHAVINVDDTMAITQNVMTHNNFEYVWRSIRKDRKKFACKFLRKLKDEYPKLYNMAIELNQADNWKMHDEKKLLAKRKGSDGNGVSEFEKVEKKVKSKSTATSESSESLSSSNSE